MSTVSSDHYNQGGSAGCNYTILQSYNAPYQMGVPPQTNKVITGNYIVPSFGGFGYDSLTSKVSNCSGYSDITSAYGGDAAGRCQTTYTTTLCGNGMLGQDCASRPPKDQCNCCKTENSAFCQNLKCPAKEGYRRY
jgi:hypothetical protein